MEIRFFTTRDRSALQKIYLDSRKMAFHWMDNTLFRLADFDHDTEGECIWVALVDDKPVGFISVWMPDNFIHNVYVDPMFVGQGIGSALLQRCLKKINKPVKLKCLEKNTSARNYYLSQGWKIISFEFGPDGKYHLMQFDEK